MYCLNKKTDVDRAFKQFVFETMNVTSLTRKNHIKKSSRNIIIPWDDPYPNINATLTEEQQIFLKSLNLMEAAKCLLIFSLKLHISGLSNNFFLVFFFSNVGRFKEKTAAAEQSFECEHDKIN